MKLRRFLTSLVAAGMILSLCLPVLSHFSLIAGAEETAKRPEPKLMGEPVTLEKNGLTYTKTVKKVENVTDPKFKDQHVYEVDVNVTVKDPFDEPMDIVIVLDRSNSMANYDRMTNAKKGLSSFVERALASGTDNRIALVVFGDTAEKATGFTTDLDTLKNQINYRFPYGGTFLIGGLRAAEELFQNDSSYRKKLILLASDGEPTYSYGPDASDLILSNIRRAEEWKEPDQINWLEEICFLTKSECEPEDLNTKEGFQQNFSEWYYDSIQQYTPNKMFRASYNFSSFDYNQILGSGQYPYPMFRDLIFKKADEIKNQGITISAISLASHFEDTETLKDLLKKTSSIGEFYSANPSDNVLPYLKDEIFKRVVSVSEKVEEPFSVYNYDASIGTFSDPETVMATLTTKNEVKSIEQKGSFENNTFSFKETPWEQGDSLTFKYWVILKAEYENGKWHPINLHTDVLQKMPFKPGENSSEFPNNYQLMVELPEKPKPDPKSEDPKKEDPKPEEPKKEEPKPEKPKKEDPKPDSKKDEPKIEEPTPTPSDTPDIPTFDFDDPIPDPSAPDSPDTIIVVDEDGTPKVYNKQLNDDDEQIYVDEDGVPLVTTVPLPKTSDSDYSSVLWLLLLSTGMVWILTDKKIRQK